MLAVYFYTACLISKLMNNDYEFVLLVSMPTNIRKHACICLQFCCHAPASSSLILHTNTTQTIQCIPTGDILNSLSRLVCMACMRLILYNKRVSIAYTGCTKKGGTLACYRALYNHYVYLFTFFHIKIRHLAVECYTFLVSLRSKIAKYDPISQCRSKSHFSTNCM